MFDDETITYNLAVMLITMDIELSVGHRAMLDEEGYCLNDIEAGVTDSLIEQIDELAGEVFETDAAIFNLDNERTALANWSASLSFDLEQFTARLEEFSNR